MTTNDTTKNTPTTKYAVMADIGHDIIGPHAETPEAAVKAFGEKFAEYAQGVADSPILTRVRLVEVTDYQLGRANGHFYRASSAMSKLDLCESLNDEGFYLSREMFAFARR
jgi:hypothetical protein